MSTTYRPCALRFKGYGDQEIPVKGEVNIGVVYKQKQFTVDVIVVEVKGHMPILGLFFVCLLSIPSQHQGYLRILCKHEHCTVIYIKI